MHLSENSLPLEVRNIKVNIAHINVTSASVEFIILPHYESVEAIPDKKNVFNQLNDFISKTNKDSTIAILTSPIFANDFCAQLKNDSHLKLWIAIKLTNPIKRENYLNDSHSTLLIITRYKESLNHTKTRIGYTYCPCCNKTTKDYGGKKHLYHEYGTLMSDVWRDISVDFDNYPNEIVDRLCDLFGLSQYKFVNVYDQREFYKPTNKKHLFGNYSETGNTYSKRSKLINGDCIEELKTIPDNSIDFCFADPPYNLNKKYESWDDGIDIQEYFNWCDEWLGELARVLKPGELLRC